MKKIFKYAAVLTLLAAITFSLCSCKALDELKKSRASYREDGSVIYNGAVYKKLSEPVIFLTSEYSEYLSIANEEIPLLLTPFMGENGFLDSDGIILYIQGEFWGDSPDKTYCREDRYDEIQGEIKNPVFNNYVIPYSEFNNEEYTYESKTYKLSETEINALNEITSDEKNISDFDTYYVYDTVFVYLTTQHCLTVDKTFEIAESGDNYFICVSNYSANYGEGCTYKVPEEYKQIISGLMQYVDNSYYDDYYDYEDGFMGLSA